VKEKNTAFFVVVVAVFCFTLHVILIKSNASSQGSKLTRKSGHNFVTGYENLAAIFWRKIVAQYCVVSGVTKQNMSPQYKPLKNGE